MRRPPAIRLGWGVFLGFALLFSSRAVLAQFLSPGPLSKQHAGLEGDQHCNDCHSSGRRVDQADCLRCHDDLARRIAAGQGLHGRQYRSKPCEGCHVEHLGGDAPVRWPGGDPNQLDHAQTGWPLRGAHQKASCKTCHNKANSRGNPTFLGLSSACATCHKDVHENRFGSSCAKCHNESAWKELDLHDFNHDLALFLLKGAHRTVSCAKCHAEPPKYNGLAFQACTNCHRDPHEGKLGSACTHCHDEDRFKPVTFGQGAARHPGTSLANGHAAIACRTCHDRGSLLPPSKGSDCVSCHKPVHRAAFGQKCGTCHASIQWLDLPRAVGLAAHGKTGYPLAGKHQSVECGRCHKRELSEDARYRRLSFALCGDCHQDRHRGEFAASERGECKPCHTTDGFRPTLFGVVAHSSTRFALVGSHTAAPCSKCHNAPRPLLDLHVAKQACADCHANPHNDQFAKEMADGGCAHCHEPNGWNLPKIDHSTWPLTGAHATAQCDSCHHPTAEDRKAGNGASYRGLPRECGGCHDDIHLGQFRLTKPARECDKCHKTNVFKIASFDHQAVTGYALTGAHAKAACGKCHPMAVVNQAQAVRWRLPSNECRYCHANPHAPRGGP